MTSLQCAGKQGNFLGSHKALHIFSMLIHMSSFCFSIVLFTFQTQAMALDGDPVTTSADSAGYLLHGGVSPLSCSHLSETWLSDSLSVVYHLQIITISMSVVQIHSQPT